MLLEAGKVAPIVVGWLQGGRKQKTLTRVLFPGVYRACDTCMYEYKYIYIYMYINKLVGGSTPLKNISQI